MVDRATSTFFWPEGFKPGSMIKLGDARSNAPWLPVTGVRGDHLDADARLWRAWFDTLRVEEVARVITTTDSVRAGRKGVQVTLYARARRNPQAAAIALRRLLRSRNLTPPPTVLWMADEVGITSQRARQQFMITIFTGAAIICLALAALGVYGIVAQSIAQRRREIAVRISLGASGGDVVRMIMREGNVYALAGIAVGLLVTMRTIGWLSIFLGASRPAESPNAWKDQVSGSLLFALMGASIFLLAALAALLPAARAARIDPVEALKSD
jgi:putative ABC transport system permease protein